MITLNYLRERVAKIDPKKMDAYKRFIKSKNVDHDTVRMAHDNPNHPMVKGIKNDKKYPKSSFKKALDMYTNAAVKEDVELDEGMKYTHVAVDKKGLVIGFASDEKDAKDMARRNDGKVVKLKKPMSDKKGDMMINRPFSEAKQTHMFDNEKDARAKAKKIGGKYVKGKGKSAGKHAAIVEKLDLDEKLT